MFEIAGKVAVVTGGASGIGLACIKEFLKNGAKVVPIKPTLYYLVFLQGVTVADVNKNSGAKVSEELCSEFGEGKVLFVQVDVVNKKQFEGVLKKTVEKFKSLDILVNNAGIFNDKKWEKMVAININGLINGSLLAFETYIPKYKSGLEGVIINICSLSSVTIMGGFNPIYTATKHAALGLSRSLGVNAHYRRTKVRVVAICPGPTQTNLINTTREVFLSEDYAKISAPFKPQIIQAPSYVAENIVELTKTAETGSVWVIEDYEKPYQLQFPSRQQLRKKITE
ncbi:hypothetical protein FQA39_LY01774 [Lamprigera yunnana]|nr:hypothetical protein FQA39_LY01774 [Lamprigera yunnana]